MAKQKPKYIFILLILLSVFLFSLSLQNFAVAAENNIDATAEQWLVQNGGELFESFQKANTKRTAFSENEQKAAKYLEDKLLEGVGEKHFDSVKTNEFEVAADRKSQNVVATIKGSAKTAKRSVVLGAHYDNLYGGDATGKRAEGAYDNATGVGALLATAFKILEEQEQKPFDIHFVFFGAEEAGNYGAAAYLRELTPLERSNILLMINFEMVGGGDYLYLYNDEVKTPASEYVFGIADNLNESEKGEFDGQKLRRFPKNPPRIQSASFDGLGYVHYGLTSDHSVFFGEGIPIAAFLGMNLETGKIGAVESAKNSAICGTSEDNFDNFVKLYPFYNERINYAASLACAMLADADFAGVMEENLAFDGGYGFFVNQAAAQFILLGLIVAVIIVVFFLSRYLNKKYPMKKQVIVVTRRRMFDPANGDPFGTFGSNTNPQEPSTPKEPPDPFEGY